jgi:hypothetical protein
MSPKKALAVVALAIMALIIIAAVSIVMTNYRPRVYAMNVSSPTSCVSGIVYFVDVGSKGIITPVIDAKTDKPKHCE